MSTPRRIAIAACVGALALATPAGAHSESIAAEIVAAVALPFDVLREVGAAVVPVDEAAPPPDAWAPERWEVGQDPWGRPFPIWVPPHLK